MANTSGQQSSFGALPTFGMEPVSSTGNTAYPVETDQSGAVWAKGLGEASKIFGEMAQASFKADAETAGKIAGLDPNYRPDQAPIIQHAAFQRAALSTYSNQLETKTRQAANDAWSSYMDLPASQRDPAAFLKTLDTRRAELLKGDVFPEVQADFEKAWGSLRLTYSRAAQDDFDKRTLDASKAATLANAQAAADTAHRVASIPGPEANKQIQAEIAAHDRLIDDAVDQGQFTATQALAMKEKFRQGVLQTRALTLFDNVPDAEKPAFLEKFKRDYPAGVGAPSSASVHGAIIGQESGWNPAAKTSVTGATGIGQIQPDTFAQYAKPGERIGNAADNLAVSRRIIDDYYQKFGGDPARIAVAYFSGPGNVAPAGSATPWKADKADPTGKSTSSYVADVTRRLGGGRTAGLTNDSYDWLMGQMQRKAASVQHQAEATQRAAVSDISSVKKQIVEGYDVTPSAWSQLSQKYATSPDETVRAAFEQASNVRSMLAGFVGQRPEAVEARVADMQANLAHGGSPAQVELVKDAQSWLASYRKDLADNPTGRFAKDYGAHVPALDFSSPEGLGASIAARAPVAEQAAKAYGLPAARYLMPDDRSAFKTLAANGGPQMVAAAGAVMKAMGARGASVLAEIGGDAPAFVTAARVAAWGGDPQFNADFAEWHRLSSDPATRKALELPNRKAADYEINNAIGHALIALPDLNAGARTAAVQAFEVRSLRNGWDKSLSDSAARAELAKTANQALGGTYVGDVQYGGVATRSLGWLKGSEHLLAPGNMRADRIGDAIAALGDDDLKANGAPPLYADNRPATMRTIAGSRLVSVGRGKFQVASGDPLLATTTYLKTADGSRFVLDLNAHEDALRARIPGLYK